MKQPPTIRDLYPTLTDEQLLEAEKNLDQYLILMLRIYERIRDDPQEWARYKALKSSSPVQGQDFK